MGMRRARCPGCKKRCRYDNLPTQAYKTGRIPLCESCKAKKSEELLSGRDEEKS